MFTIDYAASNIEQVLEATLPKAAVMRPPTTHQFNFVYIMGVLVV